MRLTTFQKKYVVISAIALLALLHISSLLREPTQRREIVKWVGNLPEVWWRVVGGILLIPAFFFWRKFFKK